MEKVPCTGNILVHFKNLPHAWVQQVWGQAADIVKHKHPALHCVVRAEVLQLRLHLPSAPFGIPVLYWDQHWDLWFVLHSSGFQHLLTTGLVFGSGRGNPREAKILAHKRGKHLCSAFTYQQNAQPRLDRATHSQWGYRNLVKPFHLCRKRAWPTWKVFYQTVSIHQRQLYTETKCLGSWVTISLMRRIYPSALSPYLPLSSIPKSFPLQAGMWYAPGSAVRLAVNPSSSCPVHDLLSPNASWPSEACSVAPWTLCCLLSGTLCCSG